MAVRKIAISLPEWLERDLELNKGGNRSARIQELIIKGYLTEQKQQAFVKVSERTKKVIKSVQPEGTFEDENAPNGILSRVLPGDLGLLMSGVSQRVSFPAVINGDDDDE